MDLDRPGAVGQDVLVGEGFEHRHLLRLRQPVGIERVRRGPGLLVVRLVHLMRHDRRALIDVGPQPARVIEVRVRVDQVADRLVRDRLLDLGDHRQRPFLVLWPLHDDDVILLVDGDAVVRSAFQVVDAVGQLLDGDGHRRGRRAAAGGVAVNPGLAVTDETVMSSTGCPPCTRTMRDGNLTPLKSL